LVRLEGDGQYLSYRLLDKRMRFTEIGERSQGAQFDGEYRVRDEFSKSTIDRLAKRAGNVCSNPACRRPTFGAAAGHDSFVNVGVAAHITAASPGGYRYDPNLTIEQRRHHSNGIWACQTHGKLIDSDEPYFTVERLREWKREAEERSFKAILGGETSDQQQFVVGELHSSEANDSQKELFSEFLTAAVKDMEAFHTMPGWPRKPIALNLRMIHGGDIESFNASALSVALESFNEITIVAPPGTGKTTTLLQVVGSILSRGNATAIFIPLGEWSTQPASILSSILLRRSFVGLREEQLCILADAGQLVLILDGWNELDLPSRSRLRTEIKRLQRDFPRLSIVMSTRRQAMDVPIAGPIIEIDTLTERQQLEIARAVRGEEGEKLLDHAWRTAGVRELISIPLYLTALITYTQGDRLPATKEEIMRVFVTEHEKDDEKADVLRASVFGYHTTMLTALAVEATKCGTTNLSNQSSRAVVVRVAQQLVDNGQMTILLEPMTVIDALASHHLLVRTGLENVGVSFQHQQFQEWYASFEVEALMREALESDAERSHLRLGPLNLRAWEESVLFACERASRMEEEGVKAVSASILETLRIDPMLSAEMIYRSSPLVWNSVRDEVLSFATRWHVPATVDRAVGFMITSGQPDFATQVWPLVSQEDSQVYLGAFRSAHRFRPGVLGTAFESVFVQLSDSERQKMASQIAHEGDLDGMELSAKLAANDVSSAVKSSVIEALLFRGAERLATEILRTAKDEVWSGLARKGYAGAIGDPDSELRLATASREILDAETDPVRRLRSLLEAARHSHGASLGIEVKTLIESEAFPVGDQNGGWAIDEAYKLYPEDVTTALTNRLRAGMANPSRTDDKLRAANVIIDDGFVADLVADDHRSKAVMGSAAAVFGSNTVGKLIDKLVGMKIELTAPEHRGDRELGERFHDLRRSLSKSPTGSFVRAIIERASTTDVRNIAFYAELIGDHGDAIEEAERTNSSLYSDLIPVIGGWAEVVLASTSTTRSQLVEIAQAIRRLASLELLPVLHRLLIEDLVRWRNAREEMTTAIQNRTVPSIELRSSAATGYTMLYERAFASIGGSAVFELMKTYLPASGLYGFGTAAARVLKQIWEREHGSAKQKQIAFGRDFSEVKLRRQIRNEQAELESSPYAEAIFDAIDVLIGANSTGENRHHALALAPIAYGLPYGRRDNTRAVLLQFAQSLQELHTLCLALVLAGEEVPADILLDGLKQTLADMKKQRNGFWDHNEWWRVDDWLELLPFSNRPMSTIEGMELIDKKWWQPFRFRRVLAALSRSPSVEAEHVLSVLAEKEPGFLNETDWYNALERLDSQSASRVLLEFLSRGEFSTAKVRDIWWLSQKLAVAIQRDASFRNEAYQQFTRATEGSVESQILEMAIAETADEEGVMVLFQKHALQSKAFSGSLKNALQHAVVGDQPSRWWAGARELFGIAVPRLRAQLFARTEALTPESSLARECLVAIDEFRDEYGSAESEPRHPDIDSGRPWPIVV